MTLRNTLNLQSLEISSGGHIIHEIEPFYVLPATVGFINTLKYAWIQYIHNVKYVVIVK